jgi:hypothetical protein
MPDLYKKCWLGYWILMQEATMLLQDWDPGMLLFPLIGVLPACPRSAWQYMPYAELAWLVYYRRSWI